MSKKKIAAEDFKSFLLQSIEGDLRKILSVAFQPDGTAINVGLHNTLSNMLKNFVRECWDKFIDVHSVTPKPSKSVTIVAIGEEQGDLNG